LEKTLKERSNITRFCDWQQKIKKSRRIFLFIEAQAVDKTLVLQRNSDTAARNNHSAVVRLKKEI
jgi:hypothetical protein